MADTGPDPAFKDASSVHWHIAMGMEVAGADGRVVGRVKLVRSGDFVLDRPMARDLYVPFGACQSVAENRVVLRAEAGEIDNQGWNAAPLGEPPM